MKIAVQNLRRSLSVVYHQQKDNVQIRLQPDVPYGSGIFRVVNDLIT